MRDFVPTVDAMVRWRDRGLLSGDGRLTAAGALYVMTLEDLACEGGCENLGAGAELARLWAAESRVEREVRLDEERVAVEMERESVRGVSPPDF